MTTDSLESCLGCGAILPEGAGPVQRYIGASPACWAIYTALTSAGEPPLSPGPLNALLVDAYAAQHPGKPSDQSIQSVAVHLLALYGVLVREESPHRALWIRQRAVRPGSPPKHERFVWLNPPSFTGSLTAADIARAPSAIERTALVEEYVQSIWSRWAQAHQGTVAAWYARFILTDRLGN
jgi:hypothetical protein